MSIVQLVDQALDDGYLTPAMEAEIGRLHDTSADLTLEDYMALDRLMDGLMQGRVVTVPRKQFINVMEELVLTEATARITALEAHGPTLLDLVDIAAYALNRLPALYATSEEGADYQRDRARETLHAVIAETVDEAIARSLAWPDFPHRHALQLQAQPAPAQVSTQLTTWLKKVVKRGSDTSAPDRA